MRKRISLIAGAAAFAVGATFGPATAIADPPKKNIPKQNPNSAGNSGHFHPNSPPCSDGGGNPHCPPFGP